MEVKTLECDNINEYLIQLRMGRDEIYQYISSKDIAIGIRNALSEKIAAHIFEKVEPVIEKALRGNEKKN